jgi:hypothetical protein
METSCPNAPPPELAESLVADPEGSTPPVPKSAIVHNPEEFHPLPILRMSVMLQKMVKSLNITPRGRRNSFTHLYDTGCNVSLCHQTESIVLSDINKENFIVHLSRPVFHLCFP